MENTVLLKQLGQRLENEEGFLGSSSLMVQSIPWFQDEEAFDKYCQQQEDNTEITALKWIEMTSKQSKELFSRLKFHALELQTKMLFLTLLYESKLILDTQDGKKENYGDIQLETMISSHQLSMSESNATLSKVQLKSLKEELAKKRILLAQLVQNQVNDVQELEEYIIEHKNQLNRLVDLHDQIVQEEKNYIEKRKEILALQDLPEDYPINAPLNLFSLEEAQAMHEYNTVQTNDLNIQVKREEDLLLDIEGRHIHDKALIQEYKSQLDEAIQLLSKRKEEALQRDRHMEHLYKWYSEMTDLLQTILGCKISLETQPPYRLCVNIPNQTFWITLDDRSGLAANIEPSNQLTSQIIQKSRQLQSLSYVIQSLCAGHLL
jgi:hypothetical protein